ncbi:uncharacterized protein TrAFT101_011206 [Trichoderma asperellum]|uniref:uncharacterized protein n=1 Tax=Trichoderma asperellum TaxID=101201 RepID=UPI0033315BAC|nr:hypothetical protein TrAFT101_011206 [Trichoderma asperellum]
MSPVAVARIIEQQRERLDLSFSHIQSSIQYPGVEIAVFWDAEDVMPWSVLSVFEDWKIRGPNIATYTPSEKPLPHPPPLQATCYLSKH